MDSTMGLQLTQSAIWTVGLVCAAYFVLILGFGSYFAKFSRNINDFFFSGQRFPWWLGAASMMATGLGSYSYLKYSEQGFNTGMSSTMTYSNDWFIVPFFMFGWLPILYFSRIKSIPEYFERRFNRTARYIAVAILLAYMFFYIGYNLYTMGVATEGLFGIPQLYSVPVIALVVGIYVVFGGQTAVIFTDLVQGIMLYLAGGIAVAAGLMALGGFGEWWGYLPVSHRLPFVHLTENVNFNTAGLFWGEALAGSIAFTFMNQGFIMRYLALKSVNDGRKACLFNVVITMPVSAIVVGGVGWLAKSLIVKQAAVGGALAGLDPIHIENTYHTFIVVCWETLRHNSWLFGFVIAALTAALMSTVDTLINACAAVGVYDIYKPLIKPNADDRHYLKVARWFSALATVAGLLLVIVFNKQRGSLMAIHYKGIMIIIPSIVTTIFMGAFWRRFNAPAACVSMLVGSVMTVITIFRPHWIDGLAWFVSGPQNQVYIYMRALFGMVVTAVVGIVVTWLTAPPMKEKIAGLTVDTLDDAMRVYKGSEPNHTKGRALRRMPMEMDESREKGVVALSPRMMEILQARPGDLLHIQDGRWYLAGLRSLQVRVALPHDLNRDVVALSRETFEEANFLKGRLLTIEKII